MLYQYNDGGRQKSGFKGQSRDCVTRAISIATGIPYINVYNNLNSLCKKSCKKSKGSARLGVPKQIWKKYLKSLGWDWVPTMLVGSGCKVHLKSGQLPYGHLIVLVSGHLVAVINDVIHDIHDPSRNGSRCVYGYFCKKDDLAKRLLDLDGNLSIHHVQHVHPQHYPITKRILNLDAKPNPNPSLYQNDLTISRIIDI